MKQILLVGGWKLATDADNSGVGGAWFEGVRSEAQDAAVPGILQETFPDYHGMAWYWHEFEWPEAPGSDERVQVRFDAVDYLADVWLNSVKIGRHEGPEFPFALDATQAVRPGRNLLAVRVLNPTFEPIEGIALNETPHRNKTYPIRAGSGPNYGGLVGGVAVTALPAVRITDIHTQPDWKTGAIDLAVTLENDLDTEVTGDLALTAGTAGTGEALIREEGTISLPSGCTTVRRTLAIEGHRLWSLEDPFLYQITAELRVPRPEGASLEHQKAVRCGFRDFRVTDGFFHLNGKRLFLKSTHTGNHFPIGQTLPPASNPDFARRDLIYAKASGFNMVRFICGSSLPEQLDLCDEIGLMIYSETNASWCLADSPSMAERYDRSLTEMLLRDRNHPCITAWGMLNETPEGPVFRHAVEALPLLREHDNTRLVLLNSGRFDADMGIGSVSNPASRVWECVWGDEHPGGARGTFSNPFDLPSPEAPQFGDYHPYPRVPHDDTTMNRLRTVGQNSKPVFVSEYGIGSLLDAVRETRHYAQAGARPDLVDYVYFRTIAERLAADWTRLGMEGVYPFVGDMLRESQRLHARQRTQGLNLLRANPQVCGHNVTGSLDHGYSGEGLWTFWREWKPEVFDAIADAWAPLRWCLFAEPRHGYAGRPLRIEAVLANDGILAAGEYPATFRLFGPEGVAWERRMTVTIPEHAPLALPVLSEEVTVDGAAGEYTLAADMETAAPAGERLRFHVSSPVQADLTGRVGVWGLPEPAVAFLQGQGLDCAPFEPASPEMPGVILVGMPPESESLAASWEALTRRVEAGAVAVFLLPSAFAQGEDSTRRLPLEPKGRCYEFHDWLYHREIVTKRHPLFDGLAGPGVMDMDYYGPVFGHSVFDGQRTPDETLAASFAVGHYAYPDGYGSSPVVARWEVGSGQIILNMLRILENVAEHPAADHLLVNLVRYARVHSSLPNSIQ